jgi:hypothetical protein
MTTRQTAKLLLGAATLGLGAAGFALAGKSRLLLTSNGPVPRRRAWPGATRSR